MFSLCLVLLLCSSVSSESVRETETWMPMKSTQTLASSLGGEPETSGDSPNGSDFGFVDDEDDGDDEDDDYVNEHDEEEEEEEEFSGSGNGATAPPGGEAWPSSKPDLDDNRIPEPARPAPPAAGEEGGVLRGNEIPVLREEPGAEPSNVLMAHAGDDSVFNKTEVLAALIAGSAVGLMFAVLLVVLLVHRMKKKDEGSYDLGKKPIYKKAPTTEIYA